MCGELCVHKKIAENMIEVNLLYVGFTTFLKRRDVAKKVSLVLFYT
jgi:hypothetical protein